MARYRILVKVTQYENWFVTSDATAEQIKNGEASYEVEDVDTLDEAGPAEIIEVDEH